MRQLLTKPGTSADRRRMPCHPLPLPIETVADDATAGNRRGQGSPGDPLRPLPRVSTLLLLSEEEVETRRLKNSPRSRSTHAPGI